MKKVKLEDLNHRIESNRKEANKRIAESRNGRRKRTRGRTKGEKEALDVLSVKRWKKAEEEGLIKKLGDRKMFYDHRSAN
ncbi:hypothetical protein [Halobacillus sp. Marseille-Q1614]|uniref:hypothetical protein n=1 Tax=Halobacillus sp. Marseille-Q1614 TaxID=2709134 RepID=UPI0015711455|nr:hypothetical protein [Halobacillus sp. Marseille-Q1614]